MQEKEDHFLEHLRTELSLPSQEEAKPMVKSVLQALRKTVTRQSAEVMARCLPEFLRNYFTDNGRDEKQVTVEHLDELVVLVMEQDKRQEKHLFKSEIQTLSVILYTLHNLFARTELNGISHPLYREVRDAAVV